MSPVQAQDSPLPAFELDIAIAAGDIDELGHVNNVVYLSWVQDVAVRHWAFLTTPEQRAQWVWVALRHEIDYIAPALPDDAITARTWTGVARGLRYARHTEIIRRADGILLATAVTQWCPLKRESGRPARLPAEITAYFAK